MYLLSKGYCHYFEQYPSLVVPEHKYTRMEAYDKELDYSQAYSEVEKEWGANKKSKTKRNLFF